MMNENDMAEAEAVVKLFGEPGPLITSTKGVTGHALGAAGAIEAVAVIDSPDGPLIATAGDDITLWKIMGDQTLLQRERIDRIGAGAVLLEAEGELLAYSSVGADLIEEWSVHGRSRLATGGPIAGMALGIWLLSGVVIVDASQLAVRDARSSATLPVVFSNGLAVTIL